MDATVDTDDIIALIDDLERMSGAPITWDLDDMIERVEAFLSDPASRPLADEGEEEDDDDDTD